jgi:hypothetical protein
MLTMTYEALGVVRKFTANPRLDADSGVRIDQRADRSRLQVRAVRRPKPGDVVVEQSGGRVYVGPGAVRRVRDGVLDVRSDRAGRVEFVLKDA